MSSWKNLLFKEGIKSKNPWKGWKYWQVKCLFCLFGGFTTRIQTEAITYAYYALSSPHFQFSLTLQGWLSVEVCA